MRRLNFGRTIDFVQPASPRKRTGTVFSHESLISDNQSSGFIDNKTESALFDTETLINKKREQHPGLFRTVEDYCKSNEFQPVFGTVEISAGVSAVIVVERSEHVPKKVRVKLLQRNGLEHQLRDLEAPLHQNARMGIDQTLNQVKSHFSATTISTDAIIALIKRNNGHKKRF